MINKELVAPGKLRHLPEGFGWVDHRLVRDGHFSKYSIEGLALYLFLVTVSDSDGISWYSDESLINRTGLCAVTVRKARKELIKGYLIAYRRPFYQLLELPSPDRKDFFADAMGEAWHASERKSHEATDCSDNQRGILPLASVLEAMGGGLHD